MLMVLERPSLVVWCGLEGSKVLFVGWWFGGVLGGLDVFWWFGGVFGGLGVFLVVWD